jgi:hypothetical protein
MINDAIDNEMADIDEIDDNANELHTDIDHELNFSLNSLNLLVGQTGSGKSRAVFREVAKLNYLKNNPYHQFIYITDEENDKTFRKYKHMIERRDKTGKIHGIPIIKIAYKDANQQLMQTINAKNLCERVQEEMRKTRKKSVGKKLDDVDKQILLEFLSVPNFSRPPLHTVILFDDATNCFKNDKDPLNKLFLRSRHHKFTYFFNTHLTTNKAVPMTIKKNMRTFWYFGGYCKQDFNTVYPYIKSPLKNPVLWEIYNKIGKRDVLFFKYTEDGTKFKVIPLGSKNNKNTLVNDEDDFEDDDESMDDSDVFYSIRENNRNFIARD